MYIHGGLSRIHAGTCVAPRTRRSVHRTFTHAGPPHAPRHAEHAAILFCAGVLVELEREPDQGFRASPASSPSKGEEAKELEVVEKKTLSAAQGASQAVSEGA